MRIAVRILLFAVLFSIGFVHHELLAGATTESKTRKKEYPAEALIFLNSVAWEEGTEGVVDADMTELAPGNSLHYSVKFQWAPKSNAKNESWNVTLARPPQPEDPAALECAVFVRQASPGARLQIVTSGFDDVEKILWSFQLDKIPTGQWHVFKTGTDLRRMAEGAVDPVLWRHHKELTFRLSGAASKVLIDRLRFVERSGKVCEELDFSQSHYFSNLISFPPPKESPPSGLVLFPFDSKAMAADAFPATLNEFNRWVGPVSTPMVGINENALKVAARLTAEGRPAIHYSELSKGYMGPITREQAWDESASGLSMNKQPGITMEFDFQHTLALAHPAVRKLMRDKIDGILRAGLNTWMVCDYVFPWFRESWGYSATMAQAYIQDLEGTDEGLYIMNSEKERAIHFLDYFAAYNGFSPTPEDVGLKKWDDYLPPKKQGLSMKSARKQMALLGFLHAYEWLKLPDSLGRYMREKGGQPLWIIANPESEGNGSDYVFQVQSEGVGNLFPEWFGPVASGAEAGYYSLPYLRELTDRAGHQLSIIQETGDGGHEMPYSDWRIAYGNVFALTAAGRLDDIDDDYLDEQPFAQMSNPQREPRQFIRFRDGMAKAMAFRDARALDALRPQARILCVSGRTPVAGEKSFFFNLNGEGSLAPALAEAHLLFDLRDVYELEKVMDRYDVIVYCPNSPRVGDFDLLKRWLDEKPGRIVITHTYVPTRSARDFIAGSSGGEFGEAKGGDILGLGRLKRKFQTSRKVNSVDAGWSEVVKAGTVLTTPFTFSNCSEGKTMIGTDGGPILTRTEVGKGIVFYFSLSPEKAEVPSHFFSRALQHIAAAAGIAPQNESSGSATIQQFNVPGGQCVVVWDRAAMERDKDGNGSHPSMFESPDTDLSVRLSALTNTSKRIVVYDFWRDEESMRETGNPVDLKLDKAVTGIYLVGEESESFRKTVATMKASRARMKQLNFQ